MRSDLNTDIHNFVFLLLLFSHSVLSDSFATPWTVAWQAPLSMGFPGKNTGVGCHALLQRIFLSQGLNLHLLHCQADSLLLSHWESTITLTLLLWISYLISHNLSIIFLGVKHLWDVLWVKDTVPLKLHSIGKWTLVLFRIIPVTRVIMY